MKVPFYTSTREYTKHQKALQAAVTGVMEHGGFILGKEVERFENECSAFLGSKFALGVASGTDALVIGSDILGFGNGAKVLTPTFTFFASASCISRVGGTPVFVDLDENTLNMDVQDAARRCTKDTVGIVPVHLFFQSTNMDQVMQLADAKGLKVLEDSAEAFGMRTLYKGEWRSPGTIGDIGVYSFFPTKTLGGYGDGGLLVTEDPDLYKKLKRYRVHGSAVKYHHEDIGYNSRLDTMQSAILSYKLQYLEQSIREREAHARHYLERLSRIPQLRFPHLQDHNKPVYYVFNILAERRDALAEYLSQAGIGYSIYYPIPLHLQKCFAHLGYKEGDFPVAERVSRQILALPMFPELTSDEVDYACDQIENFYKRHA